MTKLSRFSYGDTIQRLTDAIIKGGNTIFATIDQTAAAEGVGMTLRPTTLIIFGNPKGGTGLMDAFPEFAIELPLKLIVWQANGSVNVGHVSMRERAALYGVPQEDVRITAMDQALNLLTQSIVE
jgi:uncharacterized protein (DUF302 family)